MTKVQKTEAEWRAELAPEQYQVLREKGTERPFSGEYDHVFEPGTYRCAGCGTELFAADAKYDSGCGWPAFSAPASQGRSTRRRTRATEWCGPRSCAPRAAGTSGTSSPTDRIPPGSATASIRQR